MIKTPALLHFEIEAVRPIIHKPENFKKVIDNAKGIILICDPESQVTIRELAEDIEKNGQQDNSSISISIFIGPEGGFSEKENEYF